MSDRSFENVFRVELRFSDELETLTPELGDAQAKLADLVSSVKHPGALGEFLVRVQGAPVNRTSSSWWVWKGTTGKEKNIHGLRFVLQWNRLSNDLLVLTVRFRGRKDEYPTFCDSYSCCRALHLPNTSSLRRYLRIVRITDAWLGSNNGFSRLLIERPSALRSFLWPSCESSFRLGASSAFGRHG